MSTYRIDEAEVSRALAIFLPPGRVTELRVLNCRVDGEWRSGTYSGYFDGNHHDELIAALQRITDAGAAYFVPNEVDPKLLGRAYNRARIIADKSPITSDRDIIRRRWLLIDIDAVRPAGTSATLAEKDAAHELATAIDYHLWERGYPPGLIGDSGNGAHVMYPIDLPADDGGFVKGLLASLAREFDNAAAKVDQSVFNPARIWKLPGTLVCKGDHAPEIGREWRVARLLTICQEVQDA